MRVAMNDAYRAGHREAGVDHLSFQMVFGKGLSSPEEHAGICRRVEAE
jgi:hypothetical protein